MREAYLRPFFLVLLLFFIAGCNDAKADTMEALQSGESSFTLDAPTSDNAPLSVNDCKNNNNYSCISILDSGQGNCAVISCKNGDQIVADCGGDGSKAASIKQFMKDVGVYDNNLAAVVVSHPHADHYNLLPSVLVKAEMSFDHRDRLFIDVSDEAEYTGTAFKTWYSVMVKDTSSTSSNPLSHNYLAAGSYDSAGHPHKALGCSGSSDDEGIYILAANIGKTIPLEVYEQEQDPSSPCYDGEVDSPINSKINDRSIVLKFHRQSFGVILPGDAGRKVEKAILEDHYKSDLSFLDSKAHLLSHHGSCYAVNSVKWVNTIKPEIIIASAAQNDGYSHPRCLTSTLYENKSSIVAATDHPYGCYQARKKYLDVPSKKTAVYNTYKNSLIVLRYDETAKAYDLWTCPNNKISNACIKGVH